MQCLEAIFPDISVEHLAFASSHAVFHQLPQVFPQNRAKVQLEMHQDLLLIAEPLKDIVPCSKIGEQISLLHSDAAEGADKSEAVIDSEHTLTLH